VGGDPSNSAEKQITAVFPLLRPWTSEAVMSLSCQHAATSTMIASTIRWWHAGFGRTARRVRIVGGTPPTNQGIGLRAYLAGLVGTTAPAAAPSLYPRGWKAQYGCVSESARSSADTEIMPVRSGGDASMGSSPRSPSGRRCASRRLHCRSRCLLNPVLRAPIDVENRK